MTLGSFSSVFLPYCLQKQPDGRYAVLNRRYKPVGFLTTQHVNYPDYPILVRLKGLTAKKAAALSCKADPNLDEIYLYSGGSVPTRNKANMRAYLGKLEVLAKLSIAAAKRVASKS